MSHLVEYRRHYRATTHTPLIIGRNLDGEIIRKLDRISSDTLNHLGEQRHLKEGFRVLKANLRLVAVNSQKLHHTTLASGQLAPPAIGLSPNGGQPRGV